MHSIVLGNGLHVSLSSYIAGIKLAKQNPSFTFKHGLTGWWPVSGSEITRQFLQGLHDRINQKGGVITKNFKMSRYNDRRRRAASCAWCGGKIPKWRFFPNVPLQFCDDSCSRAYHTF